MRLLATILVLLLFPAVAMAKDLTVFAAASMTEVVERLAEDFEDRTGLRAVTSFAGSSVLARQIRQGAPADVMISANTAWMDHLEEGNALAFRTRQVIAGNRLVLIARADDAGAADSLNNAVADGGTRIALGDTDHVPVGIYAKQALLELGHWETIRTRLTPSGNTRSALAFVQRGAARYGIVYQTDALAFDDVKAIEEIPEGTHDPIRYETAVTFQGQALNKENSFRFLAYLLSPEAGKILDEAGFRTCLEGDC